MTPFPDSLREAALSLAIARQRYNDLDDHPNNDPAIQMIERDIAFEECARARGKYNVELDAYMAKAKAA